MFPKLKLPKKGNTDRWEKEMLGTLNGGLPRRVAIVGTGQAGFQAAVSLRESGFSDHICLFGEEAGLPYQRPPLSKAYLAEGMDRTSIDLRPATFFEKHNISMMTGERVSLIDRSRKCIKLTSGPSFDYDHLILATGTRNRKLSLADLSAARVVQLRTASDAEYLRDRFPEVERILIIGAGFIGLELAAVARARGIDVSVVEASDRPMARVLTRTSSNFFRLAHEKKDISFHFNSTVSGIRSAHGSKLVVETTSGQQLRADLIVVSIGVEPNDELASSCGLPTNNGILVNEHLLTSDAAISAIGDCAAFPQPFSGGQHGRLESVQNAVDHARCVAGRLMGRAQSYRALPWFWSDQGNLKLQIAGCPSSTDECVLRGNPEAGAFSVFCFRNGKLSGVESVNQTAIHMIARKILSAGASILPEEAADERFDLRSRTTVQSA